MIRRARCSQRWCRTATAALLLVCGLTYGALLRYYIARRGPPPFESIVDEANTRMSTIVPAESPAPRPPNQTAAKLVVDLYESAGCSGEMISVAQESSEMNCARCFDFCTKDFPGGGQVSGNAKSLRVRGGPGAVGLYGDCSGHWNYIDPHFQTFAMVADGCVKIVGTRPVSHLRFYPASIGRQPPPLWAASVAREGVHDEAVILRRLRYWESEADVSRCVACCTLFLAALLGACVAVCAFIWKSDRWCQHSAASTPICFRRSSCPTAVACDCSGAEAEPSRPRTAVADRFVLFYVDCGGASDGPLHTKAKPLCGLSRLFGSAENRPFTAVRCGAVRRTAFFRPMRCNQPWAQPSAQLSRHPRVPPSGGSGGCGRMRSHVRVGVLRIG